jgi:hypothetical protein
VTHQDEQKNKTLKIIGTTAGALIGLAGVVVGLLAWLSPKAPDAPELPRYQGEIGQYEADESFLTFLDANKAQKVYIDALIDDRHVDDSLINDRYDGRDNSSLSFNIWGASCPRLTEGTLSPNEQCELNEVRIQKDDKSPVDTHVTLSSGTWRILGYFSVQGDVVVRMNTIHRIIVPIGHAEAVN